VNLALKMGVKIVAFGSDAHKVAHLGKGIKDAHLLVEELKRKIDVKSKIVTK
jgi:histidinol phosphatase-like PHP family hydrolase